jgi:hypothetical protein
VRFSSPTSRSRKSARGVARRAVKDGIDLHLYELPNPNIAGFRHEAVEAYQRAGIAATDRL